MKIKNVYKVPSYWEEGQSPPYYHWYRKGFWKRFGRKKHIKAELKLNDN